MKLVVNTGSMFSGKSSELIRLGERHIIRGDKVVYIKPDIDQRYGASVICTHKGNSVEAHSIAIDDDIRDYIDEDVNVILIDEVQFFDGRIVNDIWTLLEQDKTVYVSGLDMDYLGQPFPVVQDLMAIADDVRKYHAVCQHCGDDAVHSARLSGTGAIVEIGEKDKYIPLCRKCYFRFVDK